MKSFQEWQQERKIENDRLGKVTSSLTIMSAPASFLAHYLQTPSWINAAMMGMLALLSVLYGAWQWRCTAKKLRQEQAAMEQRWAQEDMELNATVLLPRER